MKKKTRKLFSRISYLTDSWKLLYESFAEATNHINWWRINGVYTQTTLPTKLGALNQLLYFTPQHKSVYLNLSYNTLHLDAFYIDIIRARAPRLKRHVIVKCTCVTNFSDFGVVTPRCKANHTPMTKAQTSYPPSCIGCVKVEKYVIA